MVNMSGIISKIESNADKLGLLYGYLQPMTIGNPQDPIANIINEHSQLITAFKIPTLDSLKAHFEQFTKGAFSLALMAYIGGEIVGMFNAKGGSALTKAAEGIAKGAIGSTLVMSCGGGGNPSGSSPSPQGGNYGY